MSVPDSLKGSSPSPSIQRGIDQAWGQATHSNTDAASAIAEQHNQSPVQPPASGSAPAGGSILPDLVKK